MLAKNLAQPPEIYATNFAAKEFTLIRNYRLAKTRALALAAVPLFTILPQRFTVWSEI
jgi:hypothetical protein